MRQITLLFLLFTFAKFSLAYPPLSYPSAKDEIEYEPFKQTQKIKANTTITTVKAPFDLPDLPVCTPEEIPVSYATKKAIKTSLIYISNSILTPTMDALKQFTTIINTLRQNTQTYISNSIVTPAVNILKQQFTPVIDTLKYHTQLTIVSIKSESIKLKINIKERIKSNQFVSNNIDYIYINVIQPVSNTVQSINMKIKNRNWLVMDNMNETKEKILQTLEDIYLSPSLEWHLFLNKVNKKWMTFCRFLGIDSHVRHLHRELFLKKQVITTSHSHLDDIFKDMVETDYHSQFYQQQMTNYFKSLNSEQQTQVHYSKRDFIQWVKDGESMWHDFVDQMQHEWILLMQILYQDFEKMVHCLFSTPPTTMNKITCSFKNGKGLSLLNSAASTTTRKFYEEQRQKNNKKNQHHLHLHFWQHELLMLSKELEKTAKCICSHTHDSPILSTTTTTTSSFSNMGNSDHLNIKSTATSKNAIYEQTSPNLSEEDKIASQKVISKYVPKQYLFLKKHPIQEVIDALTKLQKEKNKQFTRIDKHLQRLLFEMTPPRSHQPIHLFYERLRDNASAMNKSTFNKYIAQLLYSWNSIISTTLDITTTMIDDLKWLQEKQLLERKSSSINYNQQQQEDQFKETLELIWTSSKRKLDKNNLQVIQHWESIFINMDLEIQEAWDNMLVMVDSSHRSTFQKVKQFWSDNKSRLSNFFTNIFYYSTMEHID